ncbi:hypothetical protein SUNI508_12103 [Seiridium unicorne]|uniref:Uncharacterized protein n=1 Tax=Seiridium unicorne TaxID=138068 RepID=A0ABR2UEH2_9PEZI
MVDINHLSALDLPAAPRILLGPYITSDRVTFTVINQHSVDAVYLLTRGCDQYAGWAPFPKVISANGIEYDEMYVTGVHGYGGLCDDSNPARHIHIDSGIIEVNGSINLSFQLVGMAKFL